MTLQLAVKMTLDKGSITAGAADTAKSITDIGNAAKRATDQTRGLQTAMVEAGRAATTAAEIQARAIQSIAAATARGTAPTISTTRVDAMGMTISRSTAAVAADVAQLGGALDQVRARWDPLYAVTRRYEILLAEVGAAHEAGAIDAQTLIARQLELKNAYERTTASMADQGRAAKLAVERSVAGQTITPDRGGDIAAYGAELDALQARWDPLYAATKQYETALSEVDRAHRVGAIDAQTLIARQLELKNAYERTTASMADQGRAAKLTVERSVAGQTITPDRGGDIAAYGAELDALRARYNPLWAAEQRHQTTLAEIDRSQRVGAIASDEATAAIARQTAQHKAEVEALKRSEAALGGHAGQMKLSGMAAQNLSYQLNDVFVSLSSGMNPLTVAIQQGSQITPIFGGVRGTFAALGAVLTPTVVGVTAIAGALIFVAKAGIDYSAAMRDANTAATGLGRNAGTSAVQIDRIAQAYAGGGGVTVSAARSMATEFTRTGKIGSELFGSLIVMSKDFGATLGQDAATGAKTLADLIADPARGAETLSRSLGLVDSATERLVKRQVDQGRVTEAQMTLTTALKGRLVDAGTTVAWYTSLWDGLGRAISNTYDATGRMVAGRTTPEDQLAVLERQSARGYTSARGGRAVDPNAARIAELRKQIAEERAAREQARAAALADQAGRAGVSIAEASSAPVLQSSTRRQQLLDEQKKLQAAQGAGNLTAQEEARIATALEAKTRALSTWISESQRAAEIDRIDLAAAQARDPITRAQLEADRARIQARGQEMTETEAAAAAERAYARALGETIAQTRGSIADITADAAARTRVNALVAAGAISSADAAREMQIEAQTRQLETAAAKAEGAEKERLLQLAAGLREAITAQAEAEKRASAIQDLRSGQDRIATLRAEIATIGQSEPVRARNLALLEAEQKIRNQGYTGTDAARMRADAVAAADLNTALERQKAAWSEIQQTGGDAIDTLVEGLRTGKDVSQQIADDLLKETMKLAISNPLKNAVLGQNLPTISDAGGLLGGLFGGKDKAGIGAVLPTSVATASITAGTVIVNGGVGGIGGAGGLAAVNSNGGVADGYVKRLFQVESGGDPNNKTGSNLGLAQFSYADMKQFGLSNPLDPGEATRATILEAQRNAGPLASILGRAASPGEMYLSHQQGLAGASALFKNPDQPAWQAIRPFYGSDQVAQQAITGNGGSVDMSSKQFSDMWIKKFEGGMDSAGQGLAGLSTKSTSAVDALGQFTSGTTDASKTLVSSGTGIASAGQTLETSAATTATGTQSAFTSLTSGLTSGISSLLSGLGGVLGGAGKGILSIFGFAEGGPISGPGTGTSDSILIAASNGEFMVNAASAAKHRPLLEAINSGRDVGGRYATGGSIGAVPMIGGAANGNQPARFVTVAAPQAQAPVFQQVVHNNSSAQVSTREESDGRGGRRSVMVIEDSVGQAVSRPRSATQKALQSAYGLKPAVTRR